MKAVLLILLIGAALFFLGWLTFDLSSDEATIKIDTGEIKETTEKAVEEGKEIVDEVDANSSDALESSPEAEGTAAPSEDSTDRRAPLPGPR